MAQGGVLRCHGCLSWIGQQAAAEIERVAVFRQHHFHSIGVVQFVSTSDGAGGAGHGGLGRIGQGLRHGVDQAWLYQRLVTLHIHHQRIIGQAQYLHGLGQTV